MSDKKNIDKNKKTKIKKQIVYHSNHKGVAKTAAKKVSLWKRILIPFGISLGIAASITAIVVTTNDKTVKQEPITKKDQLFIFNTPDDKKNTKKINFTAGDFQKSVEEASQYQTDRVKTKITQAAINYFYDKEVQSSKIFELIYHHTHSGQSDQSKKYALKNRQEIRKSNLNKLNDAENQFVTNDAKEGKAKFLKELSTNPIYGEATSKVEAVDFLTSEKIKNDAFRQFQVTKVSSDDFEVRDIPGNEDNGPSRTVYLTFGYEEFKKIIPKIKINDVDETGAQYKTRLRKILVEYFGEGSESKLPKKIEDLNFTDKEKLKKLDATKQKEQKNLQSVLDYWWIKVRDDDSQNAFKKTESSEFTDLEMVLTKSFIPSRRTLRRKDIEGKEVDLVSQYLYGTYIPQKDATKINNPQNISTISITAKRSLKSSSDSWEIAGDQLAKLFYFDWFKKENENTFEFMQRGKTLSKFNGALINSTTEEIKNSKRLITLVSSKQNANKLGSTGINDLISQATSLDKSLSLAYLQKDYSALDLDVARFNPLETFNTLIKENWKELFKKECKHIKDNENIFDVSTLKTLKDVEERNIKIEEFFKLPSEGQLNTFKKYLSIAFNFDQIIKDQNTKIRTKYKIAPHTFIALSNSEIIVYTQESFNEKDKYFKAIVKDLKTSGTSGQDFDDFTSLNSIQNLNNGLNSNKDLLLNILLEDPEFKQELTRLRSLTDKERKLEVTSEEETKLKKSLMSAIKNKTRNAAITFNTNLDNFVENEVNNKLNQDFFIDKTNKYDPNILIKTYAAIMKGSK